MKQDEAKPLILDAWHRWGNDSARRNPMAPLMFFNDLSERHPELLTFRCKADRYQIIAAWISGDRMAA